MIEIIALALGILLPGGLIALVAYKMLTKRKKPELKLVEQPYWDGEAKAEEALAEVIQEARKQVKKKKASKKRKGKKNARKN